MSTSDPTNHSDTGRNPSLSTSTSTSRHADAAADAEADAARCTLEVDAKLPLPLPLPVPVPVPPSWYSAISSAISCGRLYVGFLPQDESYDWDYCSNHIWIEPDESYQHHQHIAHILTQHPQITHLHCQHGPVNDQFNLLQIIANQIQQQQQQHQHHHQQQYPTSFSSSSSYSSSLFPSPSPSPSLCPSCLALTLELDPEPEPSEAQAHLVASHRDRLVDVMKCIARMKCRLTSLDMEDCYQVPVEGWRELSHLTRLHKLNCNFGRFIPSNIDTIQNITHLHTLSTSDGNLDDHHAAILVSSLPVLHSLDVSANHLSISFAASVASHPCITHLSASYCELSNESIMLLSKARCLCILDVSANQMSNVGLSALLQMTTLTALKCGSNPITASEVDGDIWLHCNLRTLAMENLTCDAATASYLARTSITDLSISLTTATATATCESSSSHDKVSCESIVSALLTSRTITSLTLELSESCFPFPSLAPIFLHALLVNLTLLNANSRNTSNTAGAGAGDVLVLCCLAQSTSIHTLSIVHWYPSTEAWQCFAQMPALTHLNLHYTGINDTTLEFFTQHPKLQHLLIAGSNISDRGAQALATINTLTRLALTDTMITRHGNEMLLGVTQRRIRDAAASRHAFLYSSSYRLLLFHSPLCSCSDL